MYVIYIFGKPLFTVFKPLITVVSFCLLSFTFSGPAVNSKAILARKQVPVLCYHQIRNWRPHDRQIDKDYIIPPAAFRAQLKMLADSGYHTILPDELYDYLVYGRPLPPKPVMLTFDDTDGDQYIVARPELNKYNFKGVYFIVTTNLGKNKYYMDRKDIKQLADEGQRNCLPYPRPWQL